MNLDKAERVGREKHEQLLIDWYPSSMDLLSLVGADGKGV